MAKRTPENWVARKNRKKVVRCVLESVTLVLLLAAIIRALVSFSAYEPYDAEKVEMASEKEDTGFIALSYFGVDRNETKTLVSTERLREHMDALSASGYVTISQQDILDYYQKGKALPKKSLFLMFEDGRRDTAIFAQKVTEEYNYLSTILTYADKFEAQDAKFLMPDDLKELEDGSFCELGTNGYRLEYINVYDRYDRFLGSLNTLEYAHIQPYLGRKYNHYLMDYVRDEYGIPRESYEQMKERINFDYDEMDRIYTQELGKLPQLYVLMHSNTGMFGENEKVSAANQPQSYWHANHLLMRIWDDTRQDMAWADGDKKRKADWEELNGRSEFQDNEIYLTCEPESVGTLRLSQSRDYQDVTVDAGLKGNKLGVQALYLRADEKLRSGICVRVENDELFITDNGKEICHERLEDITGKKKVSIEEDDLEAQIAEKELEVQYAATVQKGKDAAVELAVLKDQTPGTVEEGAQEYRAALNLNDPGDRQLHVEVRGACLSVAVDGFYAVKNQTIETTDPGYLYLQSGWGREAYSQRNLTDDVYDGVFVDVRVTENTGAEKEAVLYDNMLHGWDLFCFRLEALWKNVLNWFINTF